MLKVEFAIDLLQACISVYCLIQYKYIQYSFQYNSVYFYSSKITNSCQTQALSSKREKR